MYLPSALSVWVNSGLLSKVTASKTKKEAVLYTNKAINDFIESFKGKYGNKLSPYYENLLNDCVGIIRRCADNHISMIATLESFKR